MTESERQQMLADAKRLYLAAPVLLPLLEEMRKIVLGKLEAKHRDGDTKYDALVAELSVLSTIERKVLSGEQIFKTLEEVKK